MSFICISGNCAVFEYQKNFLWNSILLFLIVTIPFNSFIHITVHTCNSILGIIPFEMLCETLINNKCISYKCETFHIVAFVCILKIIEFPSIWICGRYTNSRYFHRDMSRVLPRNLHFRVIWSKYFTHVTTSYTILYLSGTIYVYLFKFVMNLWIVALNPRIYILYYVTVIMYSLSLWILTNTELVRLIFIDNFVLPNSLILFIFRLYTNNI